MVVINNICRTCLLLTCISLIASCYATPPFLARTAAALPKGEREEVFGFFLIGSQVKHSLTGWDSNDNNISPIAPFYINRRGLGNNFTMGTMAYASVVVPAHMGLNLQWQFMGSPQGEHPQLSLPLDVALDLVLSASFFNRFGHYNTGIGLVSSMPILRFTGYASYHYYYGDIFDHEEGELKALFRGHAFTVGLKNENSGYYYELFISQAEDYEVDDFVDARAISFAVGKEF